MSEAWETLIVERSGGVVTVTMNRPERKNAANGTMWRELQAVLDDVAADRARPGHRPHRRRGRLLLRRRPVRPVRRGRPTR